MKKMEEIRIQIVEDEPLIAMETEQKLLDLGYQVTTICGSGEKAIQQAEKNQPDLVLMDICLEGKMNGIDAAKLIYERLHIPIIFITAYAEDSYIADAKQAHPFGYLIKPFRDCDLKVSLEIALFAAQIEREREQSEQRQKQLVEELQQALERIKTLKGLIPICASCKKIRDDQGYWNQLEVYLQEHTDAEFSHGLCPACAKKLYGEELANAVMKKMKKGST